jgi:CDP-glycerol glycerophosphotransferase (TagB/SpsB family)
MINNKLGLRFRKFIKYIRIFLRFPLHLFYLLSCLVPRDDKIWVFGSGPTGNRFADNAKYFFLYVANTFPDEIRSIWISQNKRVVKELKKIGYEAYWSNSPEAFFYSLRAKYFIIDLFSSAFGFSYWFSGGGKKINLWHGMPIKKIGYDDNKSITYNPNQLRRIIFRIFIPWSVEKYDILISTSSFFKEIFIKSFRINREKVLIAGHPRNDIFFKKIKNCFIGKERKTYLDLLKIKEKNPEGKIFIYMPTYRDTDKSFSADLDFKKLNKLLSFYNSFLLIKPHPFVEIKNEHNNFEKIIMLNPAADIYPLLPLVDILITDYSSIYFDFLLLDKPIIFFPYDFKKYFSEDRELYFDYNEFTPGPKAYKFQELLCWIEYFLKGNDEFEKEREKLRDICFMYKDGNSSERVSKCIKNL